MSEKLKVQQQGNDMKFKVGDSVKLKTSDAGRADIYPLIRNVPYLVTSTDDYSYGWVWLRGVTCPYTLDGSFRADYFEQVEVVQPTSNAFSWSGPQTVDPDLSRGYAEECSEYRACTNESGAWVVEATRRKIIAQASDEAEAVRIAAALNTTINS